MDLSNSAEIKQLISLLENLLEKNSNEPESKIKTKTTRGDNRKRTKNKFIDMPEKDMHKNDTKIDQKLCVSPPTPRPRKSKPVKAKCRVCGKTESVSSNVIPESTERYKCNKCSATAGG